MRVGVLGGGQLGRMLALAGYPLGMTFRFMDTDAAPAGDVGELAIGEFEDPAALDRFASGLDVVTYEFENVPVESARRLAERVPVFPPPPALEVSQDRLREKTLFRELGIATAEFAPVDRRAELDGAVRGIGLPAVLKTRRMGYDGKGQRVLRTPEDVERGWADLGGVPLILEGFVPFERELSALAVRGRDGEAAFYPLVQNEHRGGVLHLSLAPARGAGAELTARASEYAARIMERIGYVGVMALELFEWRGELLANEMAPRVHNSGHWTIEGAECSQFENHLRAIAGMPLGSTGMRGHCAMVNLVGRVPPLGPMLRVPGLHVHLYGKSPRPGRKLGHLTLCRGSVPELEAGLRTVAALMDQN